MFFFFKNRKFGTVQNYEKYYYLMITPNVFLTTNSGNYKPAEKNWFRKAVKTGMVTLTVYQAVIKSTFFIITEFITQTGITVYGDFPAT